MNFCMCMKLKKKLLHILNSVFDELDELNIKLANMAHLRVD